ncbi:uncharacterized protein LOC114364658 [Ostrinia furnacalis]|uniref:uncharacterized protein LOC114364658 n=1 Tax=Ostrinia furnacalis TaxID=93504 RepID=UPI00103D2AC6|nr:uncharacterized protein LOC114364658 [Ostrinia furnacalis]
MCTADGFCFMSLRTAAVVVGLIHLILNVAMGIIITVMIVQIAQKPDDASKSLMSPIAPIFKKDSVDKTTSIATMVVMFLVPAAIGALMALLLIIGVATDNRCLVMTYYVYGILTVIASVVFVAVWFYSGEILAEVFTLISLIVYVIILHFVIKGFLNEMGG